MYFDLHQRAAAANMRKDAQRKVFAFKDAQSLQGCHCSRACSALVAFLLVQV